METSSRRSSGRQLRGEIRVVADGKLQGWSSEQRGGARARSHAVGLSSGRQGEGNLSSGRTFLIRRGGRRRHATGERSTLSRTPHHLPPLLEDPVPMEYLQCRALTNAVGNLRHHRAYPEGVRKLGYELEGLAGQEMVAW